MSRAPVNAGPYDMHSVPGGRFNYTITCSACGATEAKVNQNIGPATAREMLPKKFGELGWKVHSHKRRHLCPDCFKPPALQRVPETPKESLEPMSKYPNNVLPVSHLRAPLPLVPASASNDTIASEPVVELATAQPPRQPSIEDRRIINGKLLDLYAEKGYSAGWSDERLAKDLGVPRAWVAQVREFSFGPDIDEEAAAAETAADKALKYVEKAHTDLTALVERVTGDMTERLAASQALVDEARRLVALRKTPR